MVKVLPCDSRGREFNSAAVPLLSGNDLGQVVHTRASVTKQYNLVPVARQRCPASGKVTVGLASHWPCVTDLRFIHLCTQGLREMSTPPTLLMGYGTLFLPSTLTFGADVLPSVDEERLRSCVWFLWLTSGRSSSNHLGIKGATGGLTFTRKMAFQLVLVGV